MTELNYGNNTHVRVSSGRDIFRIAFCEVPRASDHAERTYQRVHTPLTDSDGSKGSSLHAFPFTIYNHATSSNTTSTEARSHYLAIEDDKAFAICLFSSSPGMESAFKVKVRIGGVNVLQHTTDGQQSQDYFVVSEQKWVWGKQVDETTARQFRVFGHARESLSARSQLWGDNLIKEVEVEISLRFKFQLPRTPVIPLSAGYRPSSPRDTYEYLICSRSESPASLRQDSLTATPSTRPTTRQGSTPTLDENTVALFSSSSSQGCSCNSSTLLEKDGGDAESIRSKPEEEAASPHQMVIGTGGLIHQVVEKDQHPEWMDSESVTLRFKIFDPKFFEEATKIPLGNPGGNYEEVPNPPDKCFKHRKPIVENPDRLRKDIKSPMELEPEGRDGVADDVNAFLSLWGQARNQPRPEPEPKPEPVFQQPNPSLPGSNPEKQERRNNTEPRGMPRNTPTGTCPTGLTRKESAKRWKTKWRKFVTAMRRLLSPGQWAGPA